MSVIAREKLESQTSPGSKSGHRSYRSRYQVITDDITDGSITVIEETRSGTFWLPQIGDYYNWQGDIDLWAVVIREPEVRLRDVRKSRKVWDVIIQHTTESTRRDNSTAWASPLDEAWTFNRVADEWTDAAQKDSITGKPIANSAHQPYTGKDVELIRVRPAYELEKNFSTMQQDLIEATEGHVNDDVVTIKGKAYAARHLFLRPITVQELHHARIGTYYRHKFRIDTRKDGFDVVLVDRGTKYLAGSDQTNPQHFTDILDPVSGNPIAPPGLPLDGSGALLSAAQITAGNLSTFTFTKEPVADFSVWGFPT